MGAHRLDDAVAHPGNVFGEELDPLVVGHAVRIEEEIGEPRAPQIRADAGLGVDPRFVIPGGSRRPRSESARTAGMQHVVGCDLKELISELGAVGIGDGMHDHIDPVELFAKRLVGQQEDLRCRDVERLRVCLGSRSC